MPNAVPINDNTPKDSITSQPAQDAAFRLTEYADVPAREGKPFLLVLDGLDARQIADSLCEAGLAAFGVSTVADALRVISERKPDVIVLEEELPDGYGAEVARQVKHSPTLESRVVLYTAHEPPTEWLWRGGLDAFVSKPDLAALREKITAMLDRSNQTGQ